MVTGVGDLLADQESEFLFVFLGTLLNLRFNRIPSTTPFRARRWRRIGYGRRVAPLKERAEYRKQWCPRSPWVFCNQEGKRIANIRNSFESARKRAGIEDFRIHDLRHTCAAWLISRGAPIAAVRDLLGHCSVTMTERYAHLAPDRVRAAVSLLDQG